MTKLFQRHQNKKFIGNIAVKWHFLRVCCVNLDPCMLTAWLTATSISTRYLLIISLHMLNCFAATCSCL